jgi:hypothetical protein
VILHPQGWPLSPPSGAPDATDTVTAPPPAPQPPQQPPQTPPPSQQPTPPPPGADLSKPIPAPPPEPVRAPGQFPGFDLPVFAPAIYRAPAPNRGAAGWGQPWHPTEAAKKYPGVMAGSDVPTPHEAYKVNQYAAGALARSGSGAVAQHASVAAALAGQFAPILDALSRGAFSSQYSGAVHANMERQLQNMRIQQQQMMMANEAGIEQHRQEMLAYGRIFNANQKGELTDEEAREAALQIARQTDHPGLMVAINEKGIKGAWDQLNWEDAQNRQWEAANTTLRKATAGQTDAEIAKEWDDPTVGAGGPGGAGYSLPKVGADAGAQTASAGETDADADTDASAAASGENLDDRLKKDKYSDKEIAAIHGVLNNDPPANYGDLPKTGNAIKKRIDDGVARAQEGMRQIANSDASPEDKVAAIENIDPGRAAIVRGLRDYSLDPRQPGATKDMPRMVQLTKRIFGNDYDEGNYAAAHKFQDQNSPEHKVIDRAGNITQSSLTLLENLKKFDENDTVIGNKFRQYLAGNLTGSDARYKVMFDSVMDLDQHFQAIASFTGTPRVTTLMAQIENLGPTATPLQVRKVIMVNLRSAYQVINNYQQDWENVTHRQTLVPGMTPHNYRIFRDLVRMNPNTQEMPSDAQPESLAVSKERSEARKGLKDPDKYPPLPMSDIWHLNDRYKDLAASPDPDKQKQAREIMQRIGPIIGLTGHITGVD